MLLCPGPHFKGLNEMQMGNTLYYRLCWTTEMWILLFCHNWYNTVTGVSPPRLGHKVRPEVFHWANPNTFPAGQGVSPGFLGLSPGPSGPPGESICRFHTHAAHFQFRSWLLLGPSYVPVPGAHFFGRLDLHDSYVPQNLGTRLLSLAKPGSLRHGADGHFLSCAMPASP